MDFEYIRNQIKKLNRYYNKYIIDIHKEDIKKIQNELLNLNLTNSNDKYKLFNLLLEYKKNKKGYIDLFNQIISKNNISFIFENKLYDKYLHQYLYYKINILNEDQINKQILSFKNNIIEDNNKLITKNRFYKPINPDELINKILEINNIFNKYNLFRLINTSFIIYINKENQILIYNDYNNLELFEEFKIYNNDFQIIKNKEKELIDKKDLLNKIDYQFRLTKYYNTTNEIEILNIYQCWIKSAFNFFINNGNFTRQFLNIKIKKENKLLFNMIENNDNLTSDIIESEKIKGGNKNEFYKLFQNITEENNDNLFIQLKQLLNEKLNNKYLLGIPGYKMYPFYVIQDLLLLLDDEFTNDCIIEYYFKNKILDEKNKNLKSFIYYCNKNYIFNDVKIIHDTYDKDYGINQLDYKKLKLYKEYECIDEQYNTPLCNNKLHKLNFKEINNKYYFNDNIKNNIKYYLKNIINTPKNLLIACPIHDILSLYMLNNKLRLSRYSYEQIYSYIYELYNMYDIRIKYPYYIPLNGKQYYLHSFIIVINNLSLLDNFPEHINKKPIDSHFVYYKIDYINRENNIIDLLRFDTFKSRLNKQIIKSLSDNFYFIKDEFNNLYNDDCIIDNLNYKVIFCYYRRID